MSEGLADSDAALILDAAERLFADQCDRGTLASTAAGHWPTQLWSAVSDAGLPLALVSEAGGGAAVPVEGGLALVGLAARHCAPIPLAETMTGAWLLDRAGQEIPDGPLTIAAVDAGIGGRAERVPWGRTATLLLIGGADDGAWLRVLRPDRTTVEPGDNLAGEPRDTVLFDLAGVPAVPSPVTPLELRALGAALRTIQIAGALERAASLAIGYARERVQFGRPLSRFQAIQQNLAVLATQAAAAGAAADMARAAVASDRLLPAIAVAKARAGEAAGIGASIAHQVHGAIGFTLEHDLQFATKRLWSWRDEFGSEAEWNALFGRALLAGGADRLWQSVTEV